MSKLSPSEKRGLFSLSGIFLIAFIFQLLQPYYVKEDLYDYSVQDSIFKELSADTTQTEKSTEYLAKTFKATKNAEKKVLAPNSININSATQKELERLPRIGPATAKNILEYREKNGSFKTIEDILKVKRIGPKTLDLVKPFITVN